MATGTADRQVKQYDLDFDNDDDESIATFFVRKRIKETSVKRFSISSDERNAKRRNAVKK